jgi:hypothetical protein
MKYWIIAILVVVLAAVAWYLYDAAAPTVEETVVPGPAPSQQRAEPAPEVTPPPAAEPAVAEPLPEAEPEIEEPALPELADSDDEAVQTVTDLVGEPAPVAAYVVGEDLVSRIVATVDALGGKQVPDSIQAIRGPGGDFLVTSDEQPATVIRNELGDPIPQYRLDPANYARYTPYVDMLDATEPEAAVQAYREWQPLFEEAFGQLGYGDVGFEERLTALIDELLATPEPSGPVQLIKPEAYYLFADEELEALSAGQKILLRMGPENAARVKAKLAEIRAALAGE